MKLMSISIFLIFMICFITMIIATMLSKKSFYDREKSSPFECGFDPKSSSRLPFSIHFFLIGVIFIIFDVEITLIIPMIKTFNFSDSNEWMYLLISFMIMLLLGLYYEWNYGALNWMN